LYASPNIIRVMKSRRMRWTGHVAHMGEMKMRTVFWFEHLNGRHHSEDLGVDRSVILEWILWKQDGKLWNGCI